MIENQLWGGGRYNIYQYISYIYVLELDVKLNAIQYLFHRGGCYVFPNGQVLRHCEEVCGLPPFGGSVVQGTQWWRQTSDIMKWGFLFLWVSLSQVSRQFMVIHDLDFSSWQVANGTNQLRSLNGTNAARRWLWVGTQ